MSDHTAPLMGSSRARTPKLSVIASFVVFTTWGFTSQLAAAMPCESLTSLTSATTTITAAATVAAGAFAPPAARGGGGRGADPYKELPAFCRVTASVKRAGDTDVKIEVWMPEQGWT